MATLYSRMNAIAHEDAGYGHFGADEHGAFAFPDELSDQLLRVHVRGKPMWEDEEMRARRTHSEDLARRQDPAALYDAVAALVEMGRQAQAAVPPGVMEELAELRSQIAALQAAGPEPASGDDADDDSGNDAPKPARRRTPAAK